MKTKLNNNYFIRIMKSMPGGVWVLIMECYIRFNLDTHRESHKHGFIWIYVIQNLHLLLRGV